MSLFRRSVVDVKFGPRAFVPLDEMKRQGVEEFVTEDDARKGIFGERCRTRKDADGFAEGGQMGALGFREQRQRFDDPVFERGEGLRRERLEGG